MTTLDDNTLLRVLAINCRLYESDPQPSSQNIGASVEPLMVSKNDAWRGYYARDLVVELAADLDRIATAREWVAEEWAKAPPMLPKEENRMDRRDWDCALELCDRATTIVAESGALQDKYSRRRLIAGIRAALTSEGLGMIPGVVADQGQALLEELARIDEDERHGR